MSARVLSAVAFKVFAIYLCVQIVLHTPNIWFMYRSLGEWNGSVGLGSFMPYIFGSLFLLFGLVVVVVLHRLGSSVLNSIPDETDKLNSENFEILLFQLLGFYFIMSAFTYLPSNIMLVFFEDMYRPGELSLISERLKVLAHIIELSVGLSMVIRAPVWKAMFHKFRYAGS